MDIVAAQRTIAAREVWAAQNHDPADPESPRTSEEYDYDCLCQWFSEKFHTPLADVYDLPVDFVYRHYFLVYFRQLAEDEEPNAEEKWLRALDEACELPEERRSRLRREAEDKRVGDKFHQQVTEEERRKDEELAKAKREGRQPKTGGTLGAVRRELGEVQMPGADVSKWPKDFSMKFRED